MQKTYPSSSTTISSEQSLYRKTVLENGVRVVTEKIPYVRSASLGLWADVGSRDEDETTNGISHFVEHMVFKGTKKRTVRDIAQSLESLGGYLNAFTTKEQTCFYARVLDMHVREAMDVLADLVQNPTFKKDELEREKLVVIEELKNAEDDPEDIIHDYFEKALFPKHSLGFPIIGTKENVERFKREDLFAHVERHYVPSRLVVAAAGNVDHEALVRLVGEYFRDLPNRSNGVGRRQAPPRLHHNTFSEYPRPINQAHVCLGTVAYSIKHRDRYPLMVMNALLGEGMSSRLYQNIRERYGFAYSVYSFTNLLSDTGVFGVYIGTDKKNIENSIELILKELERLKTKPVSKAELERTKSQIKGVMMLGLENMSGRMMRLGSSELYFESFTSLDAILKKVDAVTPEAIQLVANDLFDEERFSTVVIRPS
ncbi:MAG: insulinase family protein [Ignavibacteria bacterium]